MRHILEEIESVRTDRKADAVICDELLTRVYALIPSDGEVALQAAREIREYALEQGLSLSASMAMLVEGLCYYRMGEEDAANAVFAEADVLRESSPEQEQIGPALLNFGKLCQRLGALHPALAYLRISLGYCLAENKKEEVAEVLNFIGIVYATIANYEQSLLFFFRCLEYAEGVKSELFRANIYGNIGNAYEKTSEFAKSLEYTEKAYAIAKKYNDIELIRMCLNNQGIVYGQLGEFANALNCFLSSLATQDPTDLSATGTRMQANVLNNIGNVYQKLGEFDKSLEYHKRSLLLWRQTGDLVGESGSLHNIGCVLHEIKEYEEANTYFLQSLAIREQIGDVQGIALSLDGIGSIHALLGRLDMAKETYLHTLSIAEEIGDASSKSFFLHNLAYVCFLRREVDEALDYLEQGLVIAKELSMSALIYKIYETRSQVYRMKGDMEAALEQYMLFHQAEREVFSEESAKRVANIQTLHLTEQTRKEAEIYRLKNVEIVAALASLEEANRRLNELNEEKNELLSIAAHDLKNPLQSIKMIAEILKSDLSLERKEIEDFSGDILLSSRRMFDLITNLLDMNAIENEAYGLQVEKCNVIELVERVVNHHRTNAGAKNLQLHDRYDESVLIAEADENAAWQIIDNLISNAVKFSPPGKNIYIRVWKKSASEFEDNREKVVVEIQDEGPGLTEDDKKKLFGKFARLSARPTGGEHSTGLGLSIVKKLAEAMNGQVWCESEEGRGATFIMEIPAA